MEGIVLKAIDFRERQRIVTIYTPDHGLITVFVPGITPKNPQRINLSTPLTLADWQLKERRTELWRFFDASILNLHLPIRQDLARLQAARSMLTRILTTQLPNKSAPELYHLLKSFLKNLTTRDPDLLNLTFALKLMRHEGQLSLSANCTSCERPLSFHFHQGANFCPSCAPAGAHPLSATQWQQMMSLLALRSFKELDTHTFDPNIAPITDT